MRTPVSGAARPPGLQPQPRTPGPGRRWAAPARLATGGTLGVRPGVVRWDRAAAVSSPHWARREPARHCGQHRRRRHRRVARASDFTVTRRVGRGGAVPNTDTLRAALADEGTVTLQLAVRDLGPSVGRAQVAGVTNGAGDLVAGVERDGCRIRFRLRMRGERLGLGPLSVMLPTSCRVESGATTIAGRATHASLAIAAAWDGQVRRAMLRLAPSLGWRLFAPKRWRGGAWDVLGSIAWLTVWGAPLALWLRAAWPPPRNLARPALLYAIGLVGGTALVAMASGLAVGTPGDAVGIALGWWLGGLAARRGRSLS